MKKNYLPCLLSAVCLVTLLLLAVVFLHSQSEGGTAATQWLIRTFEKFSAEHPGRESADTADAAAFNRLSESLRNQRALLEDVACKVNGIGARGGFCLNMQKIDVGGNSAWDPKLAEALEVEVFGNQSVGDLGAGLGWYGRYWLRRSDPIFNYGQEIEKQQVFNHPEVVKALKTPKRVNSWHGYDGAGNVETVTNRLVLFLDLTEEQELPLKFDWVISLEVGEHIPHAYETIFVDNIVRHACKGVVLSWAVEGQGGHHHVNNHNNDYIKKMMKEKGFSDDLVLQNKFRDVSQLGWFKNTIMVFRRDEPLQHPKCRYT